jgi:hypothetical protein
VVGELCETSNFHFTGIVWENNSFSPLETAIWFHEKFKVKKRRGAFSSFHEVDFGRSGSSLQSCFMVRQAPWCGAGKK